MYEMTVVVASLNGSSRIGCCLRGLDKQTISPVIEVIVVDDGSTDDTAEVANRNGVKVVKHAINRGVAAARNSGMKVASAPVVAFLDDDCEPDQRWAERLLSEYGENIIGAGGAIHPCLGTGFMYSYLKRQNRHEPLELSLAKSEKIPYRFYLYMKRQWASPRASIKRDVYAFAGANMSFVRDPFLEVGGFDESFRDGAEEQDLCRRLIEAFPGRRLVYVPEASVVHHFIASLSVSLRRNYAYGRGAAQLYRKWPTVRPTFFPGPVAVMALAGLALQFPEIAIVALVLPQVLYPSGIRHAIKEGKASCLADCYVQLIQETIENIGYINGLQDFRRDKPNFVTPGVKEKPKRGGLSDCA